MRKGWELKTVADVCRSASSNVSQNTLEENNGDYLIYGASGIIKKVNFYHRDKPYLSIVKDGSGYGRITIMPAYTSVIGTLQYIIPNDEIDLNYLYYNLLSIDFKKYVSGAAIPHIYYKDYKTEPFLWMPIKEQKEIVAMIDDAFESIERAKLNAEQNLRNAKELFESYLQNIFENKGEDWEEATLGEIGKISMCKRVLKNQTTREGDIPFYKIGTFGKKPDSFISNELYNEFRSKYPFPKKGDILISASGTIGRKVVYDNKPAYFQDSNIVWINNNNELILNEYLFEFYGYCDWNPSKGATISRLYNDDLRRIKISYPKSKDKQKEIINKINELSRTIKRLEFLYKQKLNDLEELKKSILQKAFNGELKTSKISA